MAADIEVMLAQTPNLPPALQRIATTPVLASEKAAGFPHVKVTRLAANRRIHTLGGVRIDFSNSHTSEWPAMPSCERTQLPVASRTRKRPSRPGVSFTPEQ